MDLQAIAKYLDDEGYGVMGETLFYDHLPYDVSGLAVYSMTPVEIDPYLKTRKGSFQIVGRDVDQDVLRQRMNSVSSAFGDARGLILGDMVFRYIHPEHEPLVFPRSDSDQVEASVSFAFSYLQQT